MMKEMKIGNKYCSSGKLSREHKKLYCMQNDVITHDKVGHLKKIQLND